MAAGITEERSRSTLAERVKPRLEVEGLFARTGHTYRHGPAHYLFEKHVIRPGLRVGLGALGLYQQGVRNALSPVVREITLRFKDLPAALDGFKLLHLSDFHIDGVDGLAEALAAVLGSIEADLCVFTGDYRFDDRGPCEEIYPRMQRVVEAISAKHGVYGILGNHDAAEIAFGLERIGVRMLVNESAEIPQGGQSLWLAGVDDPFDYRCHDIQEALSEIPVNGFKILLAHAPELYKQAEALGVRLYLTGHTHAGQIRVPVLGAVKHNANCPREYSFGLWKYRGMTGYTSAGVGCSSLPIRYNCPPEIALFELKRGGE